MVLPFDLARELSQIGKPGNKDKQLNDIVTGHLDFATDHHPRGKLYTRALLSPHAHAVIQSIDASDALALPGVEAVVTHEDCPVYSDVLIFAGQSVAAVAAVDEDTADRAVALIKVEYEVRPAVIDPEDAIASNTPLVGVWPEENTQIGSETDRGDLEAGFAAADVIGTFNTGWTSYYQHSTTEPFSVVAYWRKANEGEDHVHVYVSTQNPFGDRRSIAGALQIPQSKVHIRSHGTGAGYGGKSGGFPGTVAAELSKKAGKPVQYQYSRRENYLIPTHQFSSKATFKIGTKSDGTLTAIDTTYWGDCGTNGRAPVTGTPSNMRWTYKCPNGRFVAIRVATNKPASSYWRDVAQPPASGNMGPALNMMAEELGMNPLDFVMKNLLPTLDPDQDSGRPNSSNAIKEVHEELRDAIGWNANYHAPGTKTLPDGRMHGIGLHASFDSHGSLSGRRGGIINTTPDGKAYINFGASRAGGGTNSAMCAIVAETIGMKYDDVMVGDWGNTDVCSDGGMQAGSTLTISVGSAFLNAGLDLREQILERAGGRFDPELTPEQLDARDGVVFEIANPTNSKTMAEVLGGANPLIGRGNMFTKVLRKPVGDFEVGTRSEGRTMAGSACEVAVDTETGEVEILKFVNCVDNGRTISAAGTKTQLDGGSVVMVDEALRYEQIVDAETGITLNPNYTDYKISTTADVNIDKFSSMAVNSVDANGPYGLKGMGEPVVLAYASVAMAIHNAIGIWVTDYPIYPQLILKALGKA